MPSYPNVTFFLATLLANTEQPQNSPNQIMLNIIQKIMQVFCQFKSLLTEHFDCQRNSFLSEEETTILFARVMACGPCCVIVHAHNQTLSKMTLYSCVRRKNN